MMYRNTVEILSVEKISIEIGYLWRREGELMILVDDDQYITTQYDVEKFNLEILK